LDNLIHTWSTGKKGSLKGAVSLNNYRVGVAQRVWTDTKKEKDKEEKRLRAAEAQEEAERKAQLARLEGPREPESTPSQDPSPTGERAAAKVKGKADGGNIRSRSKTSTRGEKPPEPLHPLAIATTLEALRTEPLISMTTMMAGTSTSTPLVTTAHL
jgi:hypothetical protein